MSSNLDTVLHLYRLFAQAEKLEYRLLRLAVRSRDATQTPRLEQMYKRAYARRNRRRAATKGRKQDATQIG